uniref:Uncharacterized protein n=1 Tax=Timema cristinae TaxID=61476 RepID=A0A7R9GYM5_TIMCR|nr:unnamed protein product [Timema cristinae]
MASLVLTDSSLLTFDSFKKLPDQIMYSSPMASLVLTDSSLLTFDSFKKLPDQIMYPYAEPYDLQKHVWDTAGQERFRSMAPMYYRNANAALLVFDITQYDSLTSVKSWVKELKRNVQEPMVLCLVGNKCDLEVERKVSKDEALQYACSIGATYFESSALHDQGIEEVFLNVALGLIRLSHETLCSSLRVYDSSSSLSPSNLSSEISRSRFNLTSDENNVCEEKADAIHAETEKPSLCC